MTENDKYLNEASKTLFQLSADEQIKKRCRDREDYYHDLRNYERVIADMTAENERLRAENEALKKTIKITFYGKGYF